MTRERSKPLILIERVAMLMEQDAAEHPELWLNAPATITAHPTVATRDAPRPMVAIVRGVIETMDTGATDEGLLYRSLLNATAFMETEDTEDPQAAAEEMASDFFRFIGRHQQLEGEDGEAFVDCGQVRWLSDEVFLDLQDGGAGGAVIEAKFSIEFYRGTVNG